MSVQFIDECINILNKGESKIDTLNEFLTKINPEAIPWEGVYQLSIKYQMEEQNN